MAGAFTNVALYDQHDFVPESVLADFSTAGFTIQPIFEWLGVTEDIAHAIMAELGCTLTDHVSSLAHILPTEWEELVATNIVTGQPISLEMQGELRHVLLSARVTIGVARAS